MRSEHAEQVGIAMKEYWRKPGVRECRVAMNKLRRRVAFLERQLRARELRGMTDTERYAEFTTRLEEARADLELLRK
jgi:hypothetical protein